MNKKNSLRKQQRRYSNKRDKNYHNKYKKRYRLRIIKNIKNNLQIEMI